MSSLAGVASSIAARAPFGPYPERDDAFANATDQRINRWLKMRPKRSQVKKHFPSLLQEINQHAAVLQSLTHAELAQKLADYKQQLRLLGLRPDLVAEGFALIQEHSHRVLGMRHHDCQLEGGWVMLNGMVAEMETGEGKTLTATLPVSLMALARIPVHVITVNDYLAQRDADKLQPLYQALNLSVGVVVSASSLEQKKIAYRQDITYCTNKTVVFDYLRDRMAMGNRNSNLRLGIEQLCRKQQGLNDKLLLRGLCFALVDEADSVLVDEARTPLVISGQGNNCQEETFYQQAYELAVQLQTGQHFTIEQDEILLTHAGEETLQTLTAELGGVWRGVRRRQQGVSLALRALHLLRLDEHYLVEDDKVVIIDEYTGRPMADRSWSRGLQQLVEIKEGCPITGDREVLARISYQRFFRRYHFLGGMTGTGHEIGNELSDVYNLAVLPIPSHRPSLRHYEKSVVCLDKADKWQRVIAQVKQMHAQGRPVLIGTRTVEASEQLSTQLDEHDMPHRLLNARNNDQEAEVISKAGQYGKITIATNMAGRGTDIALDEAAAKAGGLHVILTEVHSASRIDRQLYGRCARQGDPGSIIAILALDDDVPSLAGGWAVRLLAYIPSILTTSWGQWYAVLAIRLAQRKIESLHFKARTKTLRQDQQTDEAMAFAGHLE